MGSEEGRSGGMVGECSRGHVGAQIIVRTTEDSKAFDMNVELHQGSVLSPPQLSYKSNRNYYHRAINRLACSINACRWLDLDSGGRGKSA